MRSCVLTSAVRTPVGSYLGGLKSVEAQDLAAATLKEALKRSGLTADQVDQIILGEVYGHTPNVARCAMLVAGFPEEVPAYTVDRQCASSLQAVMNAVYEISYGEGDIILAGGVENMSRMLYYLPPETRYEPLKMGNKTLLDAFSHGVTIVQPPSLYPGTNMGLTAENVADKYGITREEQDAFAYDSQQKWKKAKEENKFDEEILPVEVTYKRKTYVVKEDEHPKPETTLESLAALKPAFRRDGTGTVTAGNSSGMNDGSSAVTVMAEEKARELGIAPLVRVVGMSSAGVDPRLMGLGPVEAIRKVLQKTGLTLEDMDLIELNEAFAAQSLGCLKELGMDMGTELYKRVNVNGGAIAHGHALGSSGTRLITTMIYEMKRRKSKYGLVSLCIGGGQGLAAIFENLQD